MPFPAPLRFYQPAWQPPQSEKAPRYNRKSVAIAFRIKLPACYCTAINLH